MVSASGYIDSDLTVTQYPALTQAVRQISFSVKYVHSLLAEPQLVHIQKRVRMVSVACLC
jgi:hypothetical protein